MDEAGVGIMPHAASAERERSIPDQFGGRTLKRNVDGHAVHMQATTGNPATRIGQSSIGARRTVTRNDLKRFTRFKLAREVMQQVKQAHIDRVGLICTMITQHMIDRRQRVWRINAILPIFRIQGFGRMQIAETQCAGL